MTLKSFSYSEHSGQEQYWALEKIDFSLVNLLVGRNATGKTRVLNSLSSIIQILSNKRTLPFNSGRFELEVELKNKNYLYVLEFAAARVREERLVVDSVECLSRDSEGGGSIRYEAMGGQLIPFQISPESIAFQGRNDPLQHPFISELFSWANSAAYYLFGSDFGRSEVIPESAVVSSLSSGSSSVVGPNSLPQSLVVSYWNAFTEFQERLDKAIIRDMKRVGYDLTYVGAAPLNHHISQPLQGTVLGLVTRERELDFENPQFFMSQGMFRALALVINLNIAILSKTKQLILIDDIGEGLDFERSTNLIQLLVKTGVKHKIQLVMTTNDRFVMNNVPLDHWVVLERQGRVVKAFTPHNSPDKFEEFKYVGLSNFDFYKSARFH